MRTKANSTGSARAERFGTGKSEARNPKSETSPKTE